MSRTTRLILVALLTVLVAAVAPAQEGHSEGAPNQFDAVVAPLVLPTVDDFAPTPADDPLVTGAAIAPIGVGAYFDVTDDLKSAQISPSYTFSKAFKAKVRIPFIFERRMHYFGDEATASGLGDIGMDVEYTHPFGGPGQRLRFQATVKLPTGDDEAEDDGYRVPLGTGSVDLMARAQYARSAKRYGLLVTGLYRLNSANETISEYVDTVDPSNNSTTTDRLTNANQFVGSAFARHKLGDRWWLHLGASIMVTGAGKLEGETTYADGSPTFSSEYDLGQKSTLVDLFPGISYELGVITPYVGVRLPVITSYDDDFIDDSRDTAFILQLSYRPQRLAP